MLCHYNIGDILKSILKFILLFIIGLSVAIIFYPFLHETGHSITALILGAKIIDFQIFPIPSVLLEMNSSTSKMDFLTIGISGMLLPFVISFLLLSNSFWKWYVKIALRLICIISFISGMISIFAYQKGSILQNDDIVILLQNSPQYTLFYFVILVLLLILAIIMFANDFVIFNKKKLYNAF